MKQSYVKELRNKIATLTITPNYFFVIESENGYYCQMIKSSNTEYLIEAVSHYNFDAVSKELSKIFKKNNFKLDKDENYQKNVSINSDIEIEDILNQIVFVFEDIYCIDKNIKYTISGDINQKVEAEQSERIVKEGNRNNQIRNIIFGIIGIVVLFFISNFIFRTSRYSSKNEQNDSETHSSACYDMESYDAGYQEGTNNQLIGADCNYYWEMDVSFGLKSKECFCEGYNAALNGN